MYAKISTDPQAIARRVARNNKRFQKLSPEKQRVAIARDALSQLKAKRLKAVVSEYMAPVYVEGVATTALSVPCGVCALGGLFCGLADNTEDQRPVYSGSQIRDKLRPYFSETQLTQIESAYEKKPMFWFMSDRPAAMEAQNHFKAGIQPTQRLQAILGNIIRNKGTFIPRKVKEV